MWIPWCLPFTEKARVSSFLFWLQSIRHITKHGQLNALLGLWILMSETRTESNIRGHILSCLCAGPSGHHEKAALLLPSPWDSVGPCLSPKPGLKAACWFYSLLSNIFYILDVFLINFLWLLLARFYFHCSQWRTSRTDVQPQPRKINKTQNQDIR